MLSELTQLDPSKAGIVLILYFIVKELFSLVKTLISKKPVPDKSPCNFQTFECEAESKDITKLRMDQSNEQHEKMIEIMNTMTITMALMNETIHSTNGKAARVEENVNFIKQQMS